MLTEDQLREADRILRRRRCQREGHDYEVQVHRFANMPTGILCANCGESWRVFHPVDSPTQVVRTIEAETAIMPKVR